MSSTANGISLENAVLRVISFAPHSDTFHPFIESLSIDLRRKRIAAADIAIPEGAPPRWIPPPITAARRAPTATAPPATPPYPKLTREDIAPPPAAATIMPPESNLYVVPSAAPSSSNSTIGFLSLPLILDQLSCTLGPRLKDWNLLNRYDGHGARCAREIWEEGQCSSEEDGGFCQGFLAAL